MKEGLTYNLQAFLLFEKNAEARNFTLFLFSVVGERVSIEAQPMMTMLQKECVFDAV